MSGVNKAIIIGNLGADVESKDLGDGKMVAKFSVATSEKWKDKDGNDQETTEWHNITAWGKLAEICSKYLSKGSKVYVEGKIQTESYEKDGVKKYSTKIVMNNMQMLGGAKKAEASPEIKEEIPF